MRGLDADATPGHKGQKGEPGQEIVYPCMMQKISINFCLFHQYLLVPRRFEILVCLQMLSMFCLLLFIVL